MLRHTIEEVLAACMEAIEPARAALTSQLRDQVMDDLMEGLEKHRWFRGFDIADELPAKFTLTEWIKLAKKVQATVFITGSVSSVIVRLHFFFLLFFLYILFHAIIR